MTTVKMSCISNVSLLLLIPLILTVSRIKRVSIVVYVDDFSIFRRLPLVIPINTNPYLLDLIKRNIEIRYPMATLHSIWRSIVKMWRQALYLYAKKKLGNDSDLGYPLTSGALPDDAINCVIVARRDVIIGIPGYTPAYTCRVSL